jgi:hypothetical protein
MISEFGRHSKQSGCPIQGHPLALSGGFRSYHWIVVGTTEKDPLKLRRPGLGATGLGRFKDFHSHNKKPTQAKDA